MLNVDRLLMLPTVAHKRAIEYARGGQLPFDYYDAESMSSEEAMQRQVEVNAALLVEEIFAEARG